MVGNGCRPCPTSLISQFSALLDPGPDGIESGYELSLRFGQRYWLERRHRRGEIYLGCVRSHEAHQLAETADARLARVSERPISLLGLILLGIGSTGSTPYRCDPRN